jgi:UDP-N-acetylmuramate--alanine ligase
VNGGGGSSLSGGGSSLSGGGAAGPGGAAEASWAGRRLHFVGLGGAGMSGLALVARALGAEVTGSDRADSPYLERVRAAGVRPQVGHDAAHLPAGDDVELVVSTAIAPDNPERAAARDRGLRELHRGELLGEVSALRRTIAVAGTHGKTTTASMAAHALLRLGWDPSYLIGGELSTTGTNAAWGKGPWLVVEADESDRSFLRLAPEIAVVTNIELDHHTTYASHVELEEAFAAFLRAGLRRVVQDTPEAEAFVDRAQVSDVAFFGASGVELSAAGARFTWAEHAVTLGVPGAHNVANAAAALTACLLAGAPRAELAGALADFRGAGRRFEHLGRTAAGAAVVDDYAHHPTEVRATIAAARTLDPRRVVAVFQPHLYSRTRLLAREFGAALAAADAVCVLDVYPARERAEDFPGVSGLLVAEAAADAARGRDVAWTPGFDAAERLLRARLRDGDLCLVLGAGNVDALGRRLVGA